MEIAYYESTPSIKGAAEAFIEAMGKLGIEIKARKVTFQESVALQFGPHNDYDILVASWGSDFPDPSGNLRPNFASENAAAGGANASNYHNPAVDDLLDPADHAPQRQGQAGPAHDRGPEAHRRGLPDHRHRVPAPGRSRSTSAWAASRLPRSGTGSPCSRAST